MTEDKLKLGQKLKAEIETIQDKKARINNIFNLVREGSKASIEVNGLKVQIDSDFIKETLAEQDRRLLKNLEQLKQQFKEL